MRKLNSILLIGLLISVGGVTAASPLGTTFTYQGRLNDGTNAANGLYDLNFALYDVPTGGSQIGTNVTLNGRLVSNGLFTVSLDFGDGPFDGEARWMQIQVRTNGGKFIQWTPLSPRQALAPAPYALYVPNAGTATTALGLASGAVNTLSLAPGAVTSDKIADGTLTVADLSPTLASNTFWRLGGNVDTFPGQFLGTRDNRPLEFQINGQRALRLEPGADGAPNVVGGSVSNRVVAGVIGATIAGGGDSLGHANRIEADYGSIGGGFRNTIQPKAFDATIGGGVGNTIQSSAWDSAIGGGDGNTIQTNAPYSSIGGGEGNTVQFDAEFSTIGGGVQNIVQNSAYRSTIGGGGQNSIQTNAQSSTISGGSRNTIQTNAPFSSIGGGYSNTIQTDAYNSSIAGGEQNTIQANAFSSTVGGGSTNTIQTDAYASTIAGGNGNTIENSAWGSLIGAGFQNTIQVYASRSTIAGGEQNTIQTNACQSTIAGGSHNRIEANANFSTIAGGSYNRIEANTMESAIGGGRDNNIVGRFATVPGGVENLAAGDYSLAAGRRAQAMHDGTFVWADHMNADYASTGDNQFCVRAAGGVQLSPGTSLYCGNQTRQMLNLWSTNYGIGVQENTLYFRTGGDQFGNGFAWYRGGIHHDFSKSAGGGQILMTLNNVALTVEGVVISSSDRNLKENFAAVSPSEVLDKVAALPVSRWNFKGDGTALHLGPMAQDFHAAFGLGTDDKHIATVDADGVALAAIQGLNQKVDSGNAALRAENAELKARLERLEKLLATSTHQQ